MNLEEMIKRYSEELMDFAGKHNTEALVMKNRVTYASAHDNYTLWDKLSVAGKNETEANLIKQNKFQITFRFFTFIFQKFINN